MECYMHHLLPLQVYQLDAKVHRNIWPCSIKKVHCPKFVGITYCTGYVVV